MIDARVLEKIILKSLKNLVLKADFKEFERSLSELKELGYRAHIKVNPDNNLYNFQLKHFYVDHSFYLAEKEALQDLILAEKSASIRSQEFEYAARLRDLESKIEGISVEEAYSKLDEIVNLNFEYLVAIYCQEIFIVIQTKLHFLKYIEDEIFQVTHQKHSQIIESIEEKVVESIELNASDKEQLQQNYDKVDKNCRAFVASIPQNSSKEIIYLQPYSTSDRKPTISLKEHLKEIDCTEIKSLTLLCTYFIELNKPLMPYIGIKNPIIDEILSDSLGWLAYTHQLISLFSLATGIINKEIIDKFVKDFNNKNRREVNSYLSQPLLGSTLGEIVNERLF